ncbi:MAG: hypothetical protein DMF50_04935 [Acidobacteria bacterium]|nr:MAG: hypothetical protein DMF50_04935 [Acidobacteriota bacterium]
MSGPTPSPLGDEDRLLLLDLARRALVARVGGHPLPGPPEAPPRLLEPQGAFVTLRLGGDLRGCIGMLEAGQSLAGAVVRCAAAAAAEDPRFPPLRPAEAGEVRIEISALELPFRVTDLSQVEIGRHGLLVSRGNRRGVLLPQVAVEQGWDLKTFVEETCLKAGLPPDDWTRGALLEAFGAQVFGEGAASTEPSGPPPRHPPRSPAPRR